MKIKVDLKQILATPRTYLSASVNSTDTSLTVQNNANFSTNDLLLLEPLGSESAELRLASALTSTTGFTVPALSRSHANGTVLQKVYFDQVIIYKSSDNTSYSTAATYNIAGDQEIYEYNDTSGTSTTYYKYRFYNSNSNTYSDYSNAYTAALPSLIDTVVNEVSEELGIKDKRKVFKSFADIDLKIALELARTNDDLKNTSTDINLVAGTTEYVLPTNFVRANRIMIKYSSSETQVESVRVEQNFGNGTETYDYPAHYIYLKASDSRWYIVFKKEPQDAVTAGATIHYVKSFQRIELTSDTPNTPNASMYTTIYKDGMRWLLYRDVKDRQDLAGDFKMEYESGLSDIRELTNYNDTSSIGFALSSDVASIFANSNS